MNDDKSKLFELRSQLLNNGYTPLPNRDKTCYLERWPSIVVDDVAVKRWSRMRNYSATGLRVENGLCVIDIDVDHAIVDDVCEAMLDTLPLDVHPERLERRGKGCKMAWYVRTDDVFSRLHTRRWVAPGDDPDDDAHCIEIFGGGVPRQFGSFGAHSHDDAGNEVVTYRWVDESPLDVPLHALTTLSKRQLFAMLDAAERELQAQGFTAVPRTERGEGASGKVYDLTDDMLFDLQSGETVTLEVLNELVKGDNFSARCSASWLEGAAAKNRTRCLISRSGSGLACIWESASGITHMPACIKPSDIVEPVNRLVEAQRFKQDVEGSALVAGDDHITGAAKLMNTYAFMRTSSRTPIIPLWTDTVENAISVSNFKLSMMPYCGVEIGARGGEKRINPVDVWLSNPNRLEVDGSRMRPDKPRPTFKEGRKSFVNVYAAPELGLPEGGDVGVIMTYFEQLLPNARERSWFMQWLAHKFLHPHIPGPAVIMVARDFGSGRGTLKQLLGHLFGREYVKSVNFKTFAGLTYQSQYTDWGLDALFAIVDESSGGDQDMSTYRVKNEVYEHIKEMVEPRPTECTYIRKSEGSIRAVSCMTTILCTQHADMLPLPEGDRRFAVLTNGEPRDADFWVMVNDWMSKQANIAALAEHLRHVDLASYSPFAMPLATVAKEEMTQLNKSPLDTLVTRAITDLHGFFTVEHVIEYITQHHDSINTPLPNHWRGVVPRVVRQQAHVVRNAAGRAVEPQIKGARYPVFHIDPAAARMAPDTTYLRRELIANGDVFHNHGRREIPGALSPQLRVVASGIVGETH